MFKINENYLKLPGSYLFSNIAKKVACSCQRVTVMQWILSTHCSGLSSGFTPGSAAGHGGGQAMISSALAQLRVFPWKDS